MTLTVAKAQVLGLIVLDALRPNTFLDKIERDGTREAPSEAGAADGFRNVLQFFAAEAGKTAVEGEGRNSPMTSALLKYVNEPNLEINFLFRNIRDDVRKATRNKQTPYMYGQLSRTKFFLHGPPQSASAAPPSRALGRDPAAVHPCDTHATSPDDADPDQAGQRRPDRRHRCPRGDSRPARMPPSYFPG